MELTDQKTSTEILTFFGRKNKLQLAGYSFISLMYLKS